MNAPANLSVSKRELLDKMLRGAAAAAPANQPEPIRRRAPGTPLPLSAEQRQVWHHAALSAEVPLYNEGCTLHRAGPYDHQAMTAAVQALVRRHEALRTGFVVGDDGEPRPRVADTLTIPVPFDDLSHLPAAEREAAATALATADVRQPFLLAEGPLLRVRAVRLAPDRHRLYIAFHHIALDGVALYRVVLPELAALHDAFAQCAPSPLPEPALQYGDYVAWQAEHLASGSVRRQLSALCADLAAPPAPLELPSDRARPRVQTHRGDQHVFQVDEALTDRLRALAQGSGATLYMVLLASYHALLHRYTGEGDIIVGGVTDLRRRPELEQVVGYALNAMALRTRPHADLPFAELLEQARDAALAALAASEVPFDEVVQALGVRRSPGRQPLFNTFFSIQPPLEQPPVGWRLSQMDLAVGIAKYDLYLELEDRLDGLEARFLYSTELFDAATIERMADHWRVLLAGIAGDPGQTIGALPILTDGERRQLAAEAAATVRPLPALLPERVAAIIAEQPDAPAIRWNGERFSYAALDACVDAIAAALEDVGVGPGALVGVCVDRSPDMVAALLAIHRVGAAYLPLDPDFPPARLAYIVESAGPALILAERARASALPSSDLPILLLDDVGEGRPVRRPAITPDDLAYVLYTSGSTGKPKGVEITHGALANLLESMRRQPGMAAGEALLAVTTLSFDIAALELFLPLIAGGEVVILPREIAVDPRRLAEAIEAEAPDVMQATPATWRGLVETGWPGDPRLRILCGGEGLPRDLAEALIARAGEVWNVYGPTETTIWSTCARITSGAEPVPIGRAIDNTSLHVLDAQGQFVPAGVVGELHIGGAGLAHGYRGRPDLTAERFGERPGVPGERLYRTGDLARRLADGTLLCLGRVDNDEKIRGYRVAVEEIEGALCEHPAVAAAAVRSWPDASGERALAAYVVAAGPVADAADLRRHLAERLPGYMVPSWIEALPALPMTPNGKIDRKALPQPGDGAAAERAISPPASETETRLAAMWTELLGVTDISRDDGFFALGGHSLLVARLLTRIERHWHQRLGMAEFFRADTLAALAERIDRGADDGQGLLVPLQPKGTRTPIIWIDGGPRFRHLALATGTERPFLGLPTADVLDDAMARGLPIEGVATLLVDAIRQARPHGPYIIGGWCTFGLLAYEVAHQMRGAGQDVRMVVLGHSLNPVAYHAIGKTGLRLSKARYHWRIWRRLPVRERWSYARARFRGVMEDTGIADAQVSETAGRDRTDALEAAAYAYVPPAYPGDVAIFQPVDRLDVWDTVPGWCAVVTGDVHGFDVPGDHGTITDPEGARVWATQLNGLLTGL